MSVECPERKPLSVPAFDLPTSNFLGTETRQALNDYAQDLIALNQQTTESCPSMEAASIESPQKCAHIHTHAHDLERAHGIEKTQIIENKHPSKFWDQISKNTGSRKTPFAISIN